MRPPPLTEPPFFVRRGLNFHAQVPPLSPAIGSDYRLFRRELTTKNNHYQELGRMRRSDWCRTRLEGAILHSGPTTGAFLLGSRKERPASEVMRDLLRYGSSYFSRSLMIRTRSRGERAPPNSHRPAGVPTSPFYPCARWPRFVPKRPTKPRPALLSLAALPIGLLTIVRRSVSEPVCRARWYEHVRIRPRVVDLNHAAFSWSHADSGFRRPPILAEQQAG